MTNTEAQTLILQALGISIPARNASKNLVDMLHDAGLKLGLDHDTADWIVLDKCDNIVARCS